MRITVLTVPECANLPLVQERIATALDGRVVDVELVEVRDEVEAARWGMTGSPTVLLDGVDLFALEGTAPSVSCRLYRDAEGTVSGAPTVAALRWALAGAGLPQPIGADGRGESDAVDVVGRGGRGRQAPAERGLRAVHQAVLRYFASSGAAPEATVLEPAAAEAARPVGQVLVELAAEDFLTLDDQGQIRAAYPFSAVPTRHRVRIDGGVQVWAMCAIDALGIGPLLGRNVVVSSTDPATGEAVTVTTRGGRAVWQPRDAVVFVGQLPGDGPAATACCDVLNFFASDASARSWAKDHQEVPGHIVGHDRAEEIARQTFGPLLDP